MNPIQSSLRYPAVTLTLTLGLLLAGTQAILHMPRMEDPSVTIRTGIVAAFYPGATSDQVESQLAEKDRGSSIQVRRSSEGENVFNQPARISLCKRRVAGQREETATSSGRNFATT